MSRRRVSVVGPIASGSSTGGAGVSTANADSTIPINGKVLGIYVAYIGSPPAGTTDVTVKTVGASPRVPSLTLLTITDAATDGYFWVRHKIADEAATDVTYDATNEVYDHVYIDDLVNVTIAQANDADSINVWIILEE